MKDESIGPDTGLIRINGRELPLSFDEAMVSRLLGVEIEYDDTEQQVRGEFSRLIWEALPETKRGHITSADIFECYLIACEADGYVQIPLSWLSLLREPRGKPIIQMPSWPE